MPESSAFIFRARGRVRGGSARMWMGEGRGNVFWPARGVFRRVWVVERLRSFAPGRRIRENEPCGWAVPHGVDVSLRCVTHHSSLISHESCRMPCPSTGSHPDQISYAIISPALFIWLTTGSEYQNHAILSQSHPKRKRGGDRI